MNCDKKCKECGIEHLCLDEPMTLGTLTLDHDYQAEIEQSKIYWNEK